MSVGILSAPCATEIIAHRGASYDAPENTLASMKLGYKQGADADECDIYLTVDGRIVLMHDRDTLRVSGVSNHVASTSFRELRELNVADWGKFQGKGLRQRIPALEEVLKTIPSGKRLFIEIKCGPEIIPELERVLRKSGKKPAQTPIIGFGYDTVKAVKARMPQLEVSWLVSPDKKDKSKPTLDEMIQMATAAGLDGLDLNYGFPIDRAFVEKVHAAGLKLYTWTVDDPAVARQHVMAGVDGITTNRPKWLREQLRDFEARS